ncbi:MAG: hypothetical protein NC132_02340 [Corallococcus sp.]|nr:hypothetical protein [Corallococcus sp.]
MQSVNEKNKTAFRKDIVVFANDYAELKPQKPVSLLSNAAACPLIKPLAV